MAEAKCMSSELYNRVLNLFLSNLSLSRAYLSIHYPFSYSFLQQYWDYLLLGEAHYSEFIGDDSTIRNPQLGLCFNKNIRWNSKLRAKYDYGFFDYFTGSFRGVKSTDSFIDNDEIEYYDYIIPLDLVEEIEIFNYYSLWYDKHHGFDNYEDYEYKNTYYSYTDINIENIKKTYSLLDYEQLDDLFYKNIYTFLANESIWENTLSHVIDEGFCLKIFESIDIMQMYEEVYSYYIKNEWEILGEFANSFEKENIYREKKYKEKESVFTTGESEFYKEQLKDIRWIEKRDEIKARDFFRCQHCFNAVELNSIEEVEKYVDYPEIKGLIVDIFEHRDMHAEMLKTQEMKKKPSHIESKKIKYGLYKHFLRSHILDQSKGRCIYTRTPLVNKSVEYICSKIQLEESFRCREKRKGQEIECYFNKIEVLFSPQGDTNGRIIISSFYDNRSSECRRKVILTQNSFSIIYPLFALQNNRLNVHHKSYRRNKVPWEVPNSELITLCEECHQIEHTDGPKIELID